MPLKKIVGIGGSLRAGSHTYMALNIALDKIKAMGWETELLDLRKMQLPFCNGEKEYPDYPDVRTLRQTIHSAQGIILATPEYHGSLSGVLKNALDLLEIEHIEGKVIAIIGILGGDLSGSMTHTIRSICRQLHAWVIPVELIIPNASQAFDENGHLIENKLNERMDHLVESLLNSTQKLSAASFL